MTASLAAFVARRLAVAVLFVVVVSSGALALARLAPGDASAQLALSGARADVVQDFRQRFGIDRSLPALLGDWIAGLATLDLGQSSFYNQPVAGLVADRAAGTARLAGLALLVATVIGLPLGVLTGARPRGPLAAVVTPISTALIACPPLIAVLALLWLAVATGWLSVAPGDLALPAIAIALPLAAALERLQSQAIADALTSVDLTAAAARGIPPRRRLWIHAARQSLRPVLGVYGVMVGSVLSGSLAVEVMTSWPGLGQLTYEALIGRDRFLVAGCALAGAVFIALGNLAADIARAAIDPRVRELS